VGLPGRVYMLSAWGSYTSFDASIVCLITDAGVQGRARARRSAPPTLHRMRSVPAPASQSSAPQLLGRGPRQVDRINDARDDALVGHNHPKTALDVARCDVFGKQGNFV
jgi:hypothetical protein